MQTRPVIKLIPSSLDYTLELAGKILLVVLWGFTVYAMIKLPETIPTHFDLSGRPDDHGSKLTLIILPVIATAVYIGLKMLSKYPHIFNYLTTITEENARKQYTIAARMLNYMKCAILLIFTMIVLFTYLAATGRSDGIGAWFIPLAIGLVLIPVMISIAKSLKA